MLTFVHRPVPPSVKRAIHRQREHRRKARLFGALAPLVPPVKQMYEGPATVEEFKSNGEEFLDIYTRLCGLQRNERMLDVGCGMGRKTLPLTQYFDGSATYEGIDVSAAGVEWCRKQITPRFPN